jgi:drug/metabolite transporter (DMT)-like permease
MDRGHTLRGVTYLLGGLLLFACMDTSVKYLTASYSVTLIFAVRYGVNLLLLTALFAPRQGRQLVETQRTALVLVRGACLAATSLAGGLALRRMPVAETTAIGYVAPIIIVLAAGPLLGERVGWAGWAAAVMGFGGVLLIARPGAGLEPFGVLCALAAAGTNAGYQLLSRLLAMTERTRALLFYTALVGTLLFGAFVPWFLGDRLPTLLEALLFLLVGTLGTVGHALLTAAYRHADASLLAPLTYLQLLWAGLLGWLVFDHIADGISLLGMAIVAASGVLIAVTSRRPPRIMPQEDADIIEPDAVASTTRSTPSSGRAR